MYSVNIIQCTMYSVNMYCVHWNQILVTHNDPQCGHCTMRSNCTAFKWSTAWDSGQCTDPHWPGILAVYSKHIYTPHIYITHIYIQATYIYIDCSVTHYCSADCRYFCKRNTRVVCSLLLLLQIADISYVKIPWRVPKYCVQSWNILSSYININVS